MDVKCDKRKKGEDIKAPDLPGDLFTSKIDVTPDRPRGRFDLSAALRLDSQGTVLSNMVPI